MPARIAQGMGWLEWILKSQFRQTGERTMDVLILMAVGHLFECYNPHQLAELLDMDVHLLYTELRGWSLSQWRRMLMVTGCTQAVELLSAVAPKSGSPRSRACVTLSVDDTVVDRWGQVLRLCYSWWSGRHHDTVRGQNVLGLTIKIGERVIPLCLRLVSKQGNGATSKPELLQQMLTQVNDFFKGAGLCLTDYPITFDSWFGSQDLVQVLEDFGFDRGVIDTKRSYVMTIDGKKQPLHQHKREIELKTGEWACGDTPVARVAATSPSFGNLSLLLFESGGKVKAVMAFGRLYRAGEILRIWKQHWGIEQFWKSLKSTLQVQHMSLHGIEGAHAGLAVKLLAYLLMARVAWPQGLTFHKLKTQVRREVDVIDFFQEHFHDVLTAAA